MPLNPLSSASLLVLENRDEFIARHIGPSPEDVPAMLDAVGTTSVDALIDETVPAAIRLSAPLPLPAPRPEA